MGFTGVITVITLPIGVAYRGYNSHLQPVGQGPILWWKPGKKNSHTLAESSLLSFMPDSGGPHSKKTGYNFYDFYNLYNL